MKLTMVSVLVKGATFTGFILLPTDKPYRPNSPKILLDDLKTVTKAPIGPNSCFGIG